MVCCHCKTQQFIFIDRNCILLYFPRWKNPIVELWLTYQIWHFSKEIYSLWKFPLCPQFQPLSNYLRNILLFYFSNAGPQNKSPFNWHCFTLCLSQVGQLAHTHKLLIYIHTAIKIYVKIAVFSRSLFKDYCSQPKTFNDVTRFGSSSESPADITVQRTGSIAPNFSFGVPGPAPRAAVRTPTCSRSSCWTWSKSLCLHFPGVVLDKKQICNPFWGLKIICKGIVKCPSHHTSLWWL